MHSVAGRYLRCALSLKTLAQLHYGWKTVISSDEAKIFSSSIALELFDISNTIQEHATKAIRALVTVIFCQNLNPNRPPYAKKEK